MSSFSYIDTVPSSNYCESINDLTMPLVKSDKNEHAIEPESDSESDTDSVTSVFFPPTASTKKSSEARSDNIDVVKTYESADRHHVTLNSNASIHSITSNLNLTSATHCNFVRSEAEIPSNTSVEKSDTKKKKTSVSKKSKSKSKKLNPNIVTYPINEQPYSQSDSQFEKKSDSDMNESVEPSDPSKKKKPNCCIMIVQFIVLSIIFFTLMMCCSGYRTQEQIDDKKNRDLEQHRKDVAQKNYEYNTYIKPKIEAENAQIKQNNLMFEQLRKKNDANNKKIDVIKNEGKKYKDSSKEEQCKFVSQYCYKAVNEFGSSKSVSIDYEVVRGSVEEFRLVIRGCKAAISGVASLSKHSFEPQVLSEPSQSANYQCYVGILVSNINENLINYHWDFEQKLKSEVEKAKNYL